MAESPEAAHEVGHQEVVADPVGRRRLVESHPLGVAHPCVVTDHRVRRSAGRGTGVPTPPMEIRSSHAVALVLILLLVALASSVGTLAVILAITPGG